MNVKVIMQNTKKRISSIESISKITNAMLLISTTKIQKFRSKFDELRFFNKELDAIVNKLGSNVYSKNKSKRMIILISSDRGFCGNYNIVTSRMAKQLYDECNSSKILVIGNKGRAIIQQDNIAIDNYFLLSDLIDNQDEQIQKIVNTVIECYKDGYELYLVYTQFHSSIKTTAQYKRVLPLPSSDSNINANNILFEPNKDSFIEYFISKYIYEIIYFALIESVLCENSKRMLSMSSANDTANDMLLNLKLKYNHMRQSKVTQEITEIVNAANAVN
jgi:F-type H+-transporting ATPase subunit gamma